MGSDFLSALADDDVIAGMRQQLMTVMTEEALDARLNAGASILDIHASHRGRIEDAKDADTFSPLF